MYAAHKHPFTPLRAVVVCDELSRIVRRLSFVRIQIHTRPAADSNTRERTSPAQQAVSALVDDLRREMKAAEKERRMREKFKVRPTLFGAFPFFLQRCTLSRQLTTRHSHTLTLSHGASYTGSTDMCWHT